MRSRALWRLGVISDVSNRGYLYNSNGQLRKECVFERAAHK